MNIKLLHDVLSPQMVVTDSATLTEILGGRHRARRPWFTPPDLSQAAEVMKLANTEKWAVIPWGGGTKMGLGQVPRRCRSGVEHQPAGQDYRH